MGIGQHFDMTRKTNPRGSCQLKEQKRHLITGIRWGGGVPPLLPS